MVPGGAAEVLKLQPGHVVLEINGTQVAAPGIETQRRKARYGNCGRHVFFFAGSDGCWNTRRLDSVFFEALGTGSDQAVETNVAFGNARDLETGPLKFPTLAFARGWRRVRSAKHAAGRKILSGPRIDLT